MGYIARSESEVPANRQVGAFLVTVTNSPETLKGYPKTGTLTSFTYILVHHLHFCNSLQCKEIELN